MMSSYRQLAVAFFICAVVAPQAATAHGDLHDQIAELTVQIKTDSANAELYFQRGELHRQHGDWNLALENFNFAEKQNPKLPQISFARGKTLFAAGKFNEAKTALDKFISIVPNHAEALAMRARTLANLEQPAAAAEDFTRAINCSVNPDPDYFLQRAAAQTALGKLPEALAGLDDGIKKIGAVISLQLRALELEISAKNYDGALSRLETITAHSPRKESWLARRGEILATAGRSEEARRTFLEALNALHALPTNRRNVPAMIELETQIYSALLRLGESSVALERRK